LDFFLNTCGHSPDNKMNLTALRAARYLDGYPVVRLCLASFSAHDESAPGQFMVGLR
jgi:hypothetical protein